MSKIYPCCDDPDCPMCFGSGVAKDGNKEVDRVNREIERLLKGDRCSVCRINNPRGCSQHCGCWCHKP